MITRARVRAATVRGEPDRGFLVNVVGTISLASFFALLPPPDQFGRRADAVAARMNDVSSLTSQLAARAAGSAAPTAPIARLAEGNRPLLVRSERARELEARGTTGATFDDVRFCDQYIGMRCARPELILRPRDCDKTCPSGRPSTGRP